MALTAKQEAFAQAIADGLNQSDAYRRAGYSEAQLPATINNHAYQLAQDDEIVARVDEIKQAVQAAAIASRAWDLDKIVQESAINVQLGRDLKQIAASNGAINTIGKAKGILIDRVETKSTNLNLIAEVSSEELRAWVEAGKLADVKMAELKAAESSEPELPEGE